MATRKILPLLAVIAAALLAVPQAPTQTKKPIRITRPLDSPQPFPGPRPSAAAIQAWSARRFGMFIHFGLYSELGGMWQGKQIDNGYSEQIEANTPIPAAQYNALAKSFDPAQWNPDAIVALAKAAGMKFIVITAKHHDGFNLFATRQTKFNVVDSTPYHRDIVKELAQACARGGIKFGVYYSSIDWHDPRATKYIEGNSNPIPPAQTPFNVAQIKELLSNYGPISEIWFDMGKPTPAQSALFARTVHNLQPQTMVSGRVFNYQGDFTVMGDNEIPAFTIDEPWQTPASMYSDTWGYRSWQQRTDLPGKIRENIQRLVEVVSRGGNYILNIGPEGNGSVVPFEASVLHGIGDWLRINGPAIYASQAQPFRALNFGYATIGQTANRTTLYLFVKNVPADGLLRLPGLNPAAITGSKAYVLGDPAKQPLHWAANTQNATLDVRSLAALQSRIPVPQGEDPTVVRYLPVIAIPIQEKLTVHQPAFTPNASGAFILTAKQADQFFNYNGYGYEDPPTLYKLRWNLAAKPGKYTLTLEHAAITQPTKLELVLNPEKPGTYRTLITLHPSQTTTTLTITIPATHSNTQLELTPPEPFYKGIKLAVSITSIQLTRTP
ncbi:MAG: alpha-L-fucosidase [Silvibacterium sp.]